MNDEKNILVVDDDDVIRMACELTLKAEGIKVDTAENGKIGIEKVKVKSYDMILLDLMMPEMPGAEFLDFVHEYDDSIIVIIITGFATIESAVDTLKKGAYDYLPKPFTPEELRNLVRKGLERRKLLKEREQNLKKIAAEQSRLTTIINCMGEGLIATDKDGQLLLINSVASKLLGIKEPCETGKHIKNYSIHKELEKWIIETLEKSRYPKKYFNKEFIFDETEGLIVSVTLAPIKEKKNEISGLVLVLMDISEERKFERMKVEFQKMVSVVAHELKAPINAIEGYLDLILKGYVENKPEKRTEYLQRSIDKSEKLRNLVQDLLSLTSIESGKITREMKSVNIKPILLEICTLLENEARKKNLKIIKQFPEKVALITGDKKALGFLFTNLISNAIKYNTQNGEIEIRIEQDGKYLKVTFSDTGIGISEKELSHIFDEFYRSKSEKIQKIAGTGLGLSIAKRIAELHNGEIKVSSKLGEGSVFEVTLPVLEINK
ncbi:response regulator [candidate division KSB1 bacterium]|nr:response regulator [candidate division KSB1 bacterium]